jgi:hypothetical protein
MAVRFSCEKFRTDYLGRTGGLGASAIAKEIKIGRTSVYLALGSQRSIWPFTPFCGFLVLWIDGSVQFAPDPRTVFLAVLVDSFGLQLSIAVIPDPRTVSFMILEDSFEK